MDLQSVFLEPKQLLWGLTLIGILLLYLIRPKPVKQVIPSLMFLLKDDADKSSHSIMRYLMRDFLLVLHLIMALLLVLSIASPYIIKSDEVITGHAIIVLDNSASMLIRDDDGVRYEKAKEKLDGIIAEKNTLVLADATPVIAKEKVSKKELTDFINKWDPSHTEDDLPSAVRVASQIADEDSSVFIISDFQTINDELITSIANVKSRTDNVRIISVGSNNTYNLGFVDLDLGDAKTTAFIKNYDLEDHEITVCVEKSCDSIVIKGQETKPWTFSTPKENVKIEIQDDDALDIDNQLYFAVDEKNSASVMVITNDDWDASSLKKVFDTVDESTNLDFTYDINNPPKLTSIYHDIIIFYKVDPELVVSRTIRQAIHQVEQGSAVIVVDQENLFSIDYKELLPYTLLEEVNKPTKVYNTKKISELANIEFTSTNSYYRTQPWKEVLPVAVTSDEQIVVGIHKLNQGKVLFYGLPEEKSSFYLDPQYPIFWYRMINELLQRKSVVELNKKTGTVLLFNEDVKTPEGQTIKGSVMLNKVGYYTSDSLTISANLLSVKESDPETNSVEVNEVLNNNDKTADSISKKSVTEYFLLAFVILSLIELLYLRWRGDL